jgi:hypothetical protein
MSPQKGNSALDALADHCVASAQKEIRRDAANYSLLSAHNGHSNTLSVGKTIFASSEGDDFADSAQLRDHSAELSRIIKSTDSPDTLSERGLADGSLNDVSFSGLGDLSMLRASRENTPFHKIHTPLSPIGANKSPDISMTPYLNCLTLDASSGEAPTHGSSLPGSALRSALSLRQERLNGGDSALRTADRPSSRNAMLMEEVNASGAAAVGADTSGLNRSLFGTSTKRKRGSMSGTQEEGDATHIYPHQQSFRYYYRHILGSTECLAQNFSLSPPSGK